MKDTRTTTDQLADLFSIERTRLDRGQPGLRAEFQAFLLQLKSGGVAGKSSDIRETQAKRYWDLGIGRKLGFAGFDDYLATIPEIPADLLQDDPEFPILLLVEPRLGLKRLCSLANVAFDGDDQTFRPYDHACVEFAGPTWIRVQDGRRNRNRKVRDCRKSFGKREHGLTALQGVCLYVQRPDLWADLNGSEGHALDLTGSVLRDYRDYAAYLYVRGGQAKLYWSFDGYACPGYGSASRREC